MKNKLVVMLLSAVVWTAGQANAWGIQDDLLISDFEQESYGDWKVSGTAFGSGPVEGTLPGQMEVSGFQGRRLVNSFQGGDDSTGELLSPEFMIQRPFINFLVGGGKHPGKTAIELLVDQEVVRSETGPNDQAGGSEALDWVSWDVADLQGTTARIRIVDQQKGSWGHINVDHIIQSQTRKLGRFVDTRRTLQVTGNRLLIPIKNDAPAVDIHIHHGDQLLHQFTANLATDEVEWWSPLDFTQYKNQSVTLSATKLPRESRGFQNIQFRDELPELAPSYSEALRPQLRFSQKRGWNNDPNGMVYLDGKYHLFWQSNPFGWNWANMYWGHATSTDLVHWEQHPYALYPHVMAQGLCFSGGGHVDIKNSGGWQVGDQPVMVLGFTDTGSGEAMIISRDSGKTFENIQPHPVVKHTGRDPKLVWYEYQPGERPISQTAEKLGGHWVMAVYDEDAATGRNISFYISTDLRNWDLASRLEGFFECPELFPLPVDTDPEKQKWVLFAADAQYVIGDFDGQTFHRDHPGKHRLHYGAFYASQCFSNAPDGRVIQIGWARIPMPQMPFNQAFSLPIELQIHSTPEGLRMKATPIQELEQLRKEPIEFLEKTVSSEPWNVPLDSQLIDMELLIEPGDAKRLQLNFGGNQLDIDFVNQRIGEIPFQLSEGRLHLRMVIDRPMYELVVNQGDAYLTAERSDKGKMLGSLSLQTDSGQMSVKRLTIYPMHSIWKGKQ